MKCRWIAGIVCALYLSVGAFAAAMHDHSHDALKGGEQQCATCAWHHQAVDVPTVGPRVAAPKGIILRHEGEFFQFIDISAGIHPSRGPPLFPH